MYRSDGESTVIGRCRGLDRRTIVAVVVDGRRRLGGRFGGCRQRRRRYRRGAAAVSRVSVCVASRLVQAEATRSLESSNPVGFEIQSPGVVGLLLVRRDVPDSVGVVVSVVAVWVDLLSVPRPELVAVVSHCAL